MVGFRLTVFGWGGAGGIRRVRMLGVPRSARISLQVNEQVINSSRRSRNEMVMLELSFKEPQARGERRSNDNLRAAVQNKVPPQSMRDGPGRGILSEVEKRGARDSPMSRLPEGVAGWSGMGGLPYPCPS